MNNAWTSHPIRALIAADLCVNILLGLPFLKHNKIVIDHNADTAIAKDSNFDLLNENKFILPKIPPPSCQSLKNDHKRILHLCHLISQELKWKCSECLSLQNNDSFNNFNHHNHITSIKATIECLMSKQELLSLETSLKDEFKQIFSPIPHIDLLPLHKPAHIHFKDAYKKNL